MDYRDKFEEERREVINLAKGGVKTNVPLKKNQKKYLKNLLLFALMRASVNQTVSKKSFLGLVSKLFKKYIVKILAASLKKSPAYNEDEDNEFFLDENIEVELNNIIANEQLLDFSRIQASLTPQNIMGEIRNLSEQVGERQVMSKLMTLRDVKTNHRETPEELRERQERQRQRERQREMQNVRSRERGARER